MMCNIFSQQSGNTIRTKESRIKNSRKRIFWLHISKKVQNWTSNLPNIIKNRTVHKHQNVQSTINMFCCTIFLFLKSSVSYHKWRHMLKWSLKYISCFSTIFHSVYNKLLMYLACIIFHHFLGQLYVILFQLWTPSSTLYIGQSYSLRNLAY